jgi:SAM-dependent methyltransferase
MKPNDKKTEAKTRHPRFARRLPPPRSSRTTGNVCEKEEMTFEELTLIGCGHTAHQLLWAGAEFDLFSLLSQKGPQTRREIATALSLADQPTRILLQGLVGLRLLKRLDGRFANSAVAEKHLVRGRPGCMIPVLGWQHHIVYPGLLDFVESLKTNRNVGLRRFPGQGDTLYERLRSHPFEERVFQDAMSNLSRQANRQFAEIAPLTGVRRLVDAGGGDGTNAINLVRRWPQLNAVVFDSASVTAIARKHIAAEGLSERVDTVVGDFLLNPFPPDCDAILLAHILTIWSPERNQALLKKCCDSLPDGGKLFIFNMVARDEDDGPLVNALGSPYFQAIATGEGMMYAGSDYEAWLHAAGFAKISRLSLPLEHALFIAEK